VGGFVVYFAVGRGPGAAVGLEGGAEDEFTGGREGEREEGRARIMGGFKKSMREIS